MVVFDKVYDLTDFIEYHPGGYEICMEYAGTDATNAFNEKPHTIDAVDMLEKYLIGELVKVSGKILSFFDCAWIFFMISIALGMPPSCFLFSFVVVCFCYCTIKDF